MPSKPIKQTCAPGWKNAVGGLRCHQWGKGEWKVRGRIGRIPPREVPQRLEQDSGGGEEMSQLDPYRELAEAIGAGGSEIIAKIFQLLATEDEAKVLLAASPPATVEQLAQKTGFAEEKLLELIRSLFQKGLLFYSEKAGVRRYYRVRHVPQLHDATAVAEDAPRELLDLWRLYTDTEWPNYAKKVEAFLPQAPIRVIPVNVSFQGGSRILAFDDVRSVVDGARNLAVTRCTCRAIARRCDKPLEVCIQVNRAADYAVERGTGRPISKDEALEILRRCEEEGLVHVVDNRKEVDHVICNCCKCCCMNWPPLKAGVKRFILPSRFVARVDQSLCSGCGTCTQRCFFDAIELTDGEVAKVDPDKCMGCGVCMVKCPTEAISLEEVRSEDFIPQ